MAFYLEKEKTVSTPYILIDEENRYMKMEGCSFHENVLEFYADINSWLDAFLIKDFNTFTFDCTMDYINTSTVKVLYNMLMKMEKYASEKKIIVNWITTENNEIIIECGEDFMEDITNLTFNLVIN
jgi:hypothetical protein